MSDQKTSTDGGYSAPKPDTSGKETLAVILFFVILIGIVAATWYIIANNLVETVVAIIVAIVLIILAILLILSLVVGTHAFFKKKDTIHYESSATLDDLKEVDREMTKEK